MVSNMKFTLSLDIKKKKHFVVSIASNYNILYTNVKFIEK